MKFIQLMNKFYVQFNFSYKIHVNSIKAHVPFNERDVHHYHCTKELDLSPMKCPIKMTSLEETCFINFECEIEPEG